MRLLLWPIAFALVACSDAPAGKPPRTAMDRQQATDAALSKTPEARSYRFDGNELKILEVPVRDASGFVDIQRCFVWRDQEFKSATISCGQMPEVLLSPAP